MPGKISLTQYILEQQRVHQGVSGNFTLLLNDIALACKKISHLVNQGDLVGVLGNAESENVQGEVQKKLDIISNDIMNDTLRWNGHLAGMASEEDEEWIKIPESAPKGHYLALFDPLDGSSNIDLNLTVGTIFSILRYDDKPDPGLDDFLKPGTQQVCAGFVLYGPSTIMVLTTGNGVNGFTLDQEVGEFYLTHRDMKIPEDCNEFAINMSNRQFWEAPVQQYVDECMQGVNGPRGEYFNMRWIASLVAEVYRVLTRGGIFMYPYDNKNPEQAGRLRLMYEANPMAFIVEQAGGACSTGRQRILEIQPEGIHQRVPVILGSRNEVERIVSYHQQQG